LISICCTDPLVKPNVVRANSYIWPALLMPEAKVSVAVADGKSMVV